MTWRSLGMALVLGTATVASTGCTGMNLRQIPLVSQRNNDSDPIAAKVAFARLCERHGQVEQARQTYQSLLKHDPRMQTPLHRLAVMSARQGKFDEANRYFEKALAAGAPTAELLSDHGYALYLEDRLEEAEQELRDATTLDPQYKAAKVNLGLVLGQQERLGESFAAFKDAVGEAQAYANLAYVHAQRNDFQQAEMLYSRALSTNPEMRSAALALVQLNEIKKRQQDESGVKQAKANEPIAPQQSKAAEDNLVDSRRTQTIADIPTRSITPPAEPRTASMAVSVERDRSTAPQQNAAINSAAEPPRQADLGATPANPVAAQVRPATTMNEQTDKAAAGASETASRSFVPYLRATRMERNWGTGESLQQGAAIKADTEPPRQAGLSKSPAYPIDAQVRSTSPASKPIDKATAGASETAERSFVPRLRGAERGHEWRTGAAPQQHSASNSAVEPSRQAGLAALPAKPIDTQAHPTPTASKPTDKVTAGGETASRSFVPRPQSTQMGQNSETEKSPSPTLSRSGVRAPRQTQSVSDLAQEEIRSKSVSTSPPIQVTTRQAEQVMERPAGKAAPAGTARATVTQASQLSPDAEPTRQMTATTTFKAPPTATQPQVIDMTKVQGKAPTPAQPSKDEAPINISLQKNPLPSEKGNVQSVPASATAEAPATKILKQGNTPLPATVSTSTPSALKGNVQSVPASATANAPATKILKQGNTPLPATVSTSTPSAPAVQSVSRKTPDARSTTLTTSQEDTPLKATETVAGKQPSPSRVAQIPPAPPMPPSRKPLKPTESVPVSTQASAALNADNLAPKMPTKPTETYRIKGVLISDESNTSDSRSKTSGANSPARLEPTGRPSLQQSGQPANQKTPAGRKPIDGQRNEDAAKPASASSDLPRNMDLTPRNMDLPVQSSAVRYVDHRDVLPAAAGGPSKVQPALATDAPESNPEAPNAIPFSYPSTNNPGTDILNAAPFQGARTPPPSAPPAAASRNQQSARPSATTSSLPGYAGASD